MGILLLKLFYSLLLIGGVALVISIIIMFLKLIFSIFISGVGQDHQTISIPLRYKLKALRSSLQMASIHKAEPPSHMQRQVERLKSLLWLICIPYIIVLALVWCFFLFGLIFSIILAAFDLLQGDMEGALQIIKGFFNIMWAIVDYFLLFGWIS